MRPPLVLSFTLLAAVLLSGQVMQQAFFVGTVALPAIPTGMDIWLSADCTTFTASVCSSPSDATQITAWADRSGNANNVNCVNNTTTFHTAQINARAAITFTTGSHCGAASGFGSVGGQNDIFIVLKRNDTTSKYTLTAGIFQSLKYWSGPTLQQGMDSAGSAAGVSGNAATDTSWHQMNMQFKNSGSSGTTTYRLNRASDGSSASTVNASQKAQSVGWYSPSTGNEFFIGQIAEFITYSGTHADGTEVTPVETYLNAKYGL